MRACGFGNIERFGVPFLSVGDQFVTAVLSAMYLFRVHDPIERRSGGKSLPHHRQGLRGWRALCKANSYFTDPKRAIMAKYRSIEK